MTPAEVNRFNTLYQRHLRLVNQYYDAFMIKYADTALPSHLKALNAIGSCRIPDSGEVYVHCPDCNHGQWRPLSCGHRSCPKYQNHEAGQWIDRQRKSYYLLPILWLLLHCLMNSDH